MIPVTGSYKLQVKLASSPTTPLQYTIGYVTAAADASGLSAETNARGTVPSNTAVDVMPATGGVTSNECFYLKIYNADSASAIVTVQAYDGSNTNIEWTQTLAAGVTLLYQDGVGWQSSTGASSLVNSFTSSDGSLTLSGISGDITQTFNGYWLNSVLINGHIDASVSGNALTVTIKDPNNANPSASSPVKALFRSATAGTGDLTLRSITASNSATISSGSTMGVANSTPFRLWVVLMDDTGGNGLVLGIVNCLSGTNIMPLRDDLILSSTAEGGAGAADSAQVIYSPTAVSSKAVRVLGYLEWSSGLGTAGTWNTAPTKIQQMQPGVTLPGGIIQSASSYVGTSATGSTTVPNDNTIPQNTEGDQYMSKAITPTSKANVLRIKSQVNMANTGAGQYTASLFQDTTANALASTGMNGLSASAACVLPIGYEMLANTTSSTTFKVRAGSSAAGTTTFNGQAGTQQYGGVNASYLEILEIMA